MAIAIPKLSVQQENNLSRIYAGFKFASTPSILTDLIYTHAPRFDEVGNGAQSIHSVLVILRATGVMEVPKVVIYKTALVTQPNAEPLARRTGFSSPSNNPMSSVKTPLTQPFDVFD